MAYEVTATRRRPKTFDELAGQDFVVSTLRSSIESGRVAHAYLFSGPRGCGKTSAARILARSLNCEKGSSSSPCGVCSACVEIARGSSMDVIEIDGASNTSVNDVRQIKDEVLFPPNSSRYKIYIIDEVHMLSNSAFNALLKTIEEPPPYVIFIFATTELHKVPATIKSRCQQFNFRLISIEKIKEILSEACSELGIKAEDDALFWIAKESTGSLRDAYTLFDQVAAFSDGELTAEKIREKLGLVGLDAVNAMAEACAEGRAADALEGVDSILQAGVSVEQFVVDLAEYFRSLLLLKNGITREALLGYGPERYSAKVLDAFSPQQIERALSALLDLHRNLRITLNPRYELETAIYRLCWLSRWISAEELRASIDGVRGLLLSPPTLNARASPPQERELPQAPEVESGGERPAEKQKAPEPSISKDGDSKPLDQEDISLEGGLSAGFKRFLAQRSQGQREPVELVLPKVEEGPREPEPPEEPQAASAPPPQKPQEPVPQVPADSTSETGIPTESLIPLREAVILALRKERSLLASGLEKTLPWELDVSTVVMPATDRLTAELLRKDIPVITAALSAERGEALAVSVVEREAPKAKPNSSAAIEASPQLELVRKLFRGTIVRSVGAV